MIELGSTDSRGASSPWITARNDRPSSKEAHPEDARPIAPDGAHDNEASTDDRWIQAETPITPDDPDVPDAPPPPDEGEPEIDDQPLGVPDDLDPDDAPLPGLPESEPPQAD